MTIYEAVLVYIATLGADRFTFSMFWKYLWQEKIVTKKEEKGLAADAMARRIKEGWLSPPEAKDPEDGGSRAMWYRILKRPGATLALVKTPEPEWTPPVLTSRDAVERMLLALKKVKSNELLAPFGKAERRITMNAFLPFTAEVLPTGVMQKVNRALPAITYDQLRHLADQEFLGDYINEVAGPSILYFRNDQGVSVTTLGSFVYTSNAGLEKLATISDFSLFFTRMSTAERQKRGGSL